MTRILKLQRLPLSIDTIRGVISATSSTTACCEG